MALESGTRLGSYEVTGRLGEGGMGVVYRARDVKLGRDVALKVLPESLARDLDRLARFKREAHVLASLNHPHIGAIYGFEDTDGVNALVLELVEGPTLADRIAQGPIPVDDALPIARQIAEALEAAHEQGIIHRDLKPTNVKVRHDGTVKVLDFGLAKAMEPVGALSPNVTQSPTITSPAMMTGVGVLLGTAAYMSPEQAKGRAADKRSDIWAFGCVVYEMLTGKRAFDGEDLSDTLANVLKSEPDWSALPLDLPPAIRVLLQRCLSKDHRKRVADVSTASFVIDEQGRLLAAGGATESSSARSSPAALWVRMLGLTAALLLGGVLTWMVKPSAQAPTQTPAHVQVALPPGDRLDLAGLNVAVSADGNTLAYVGSHQGVARLYVREINGVDAKVIAGTEGALSPFFSPDGRWIGFFADGRLKKVQVAGAAPTILCDAPLSGGAAWGDDTIVFSPSAEGLAWVSAAGGQPKALTTPDLTNNEYSHRYPQFLPDGKTILFTARNGFGWDESRIEALQLDTGQRRVLIRGGHTGRYLPTGHLVYYRAGALLAVPFDPARLEVTGGTPVTMVDGVRENGLNVGAAYATSPAGVLAYVAAAASSRQFDQRLLWVDRLGRAEPLPAPPRAYVAPALSPNGQEVAVGIRSEKDEIWLYDLARGSLNRLAAARGSRLGPVWTPDGKRIVYRSNQAGNWNLYWSPVDGSGPEERLTTSNYSHAPLSWSPDGKVLAFVEINPTTSADIWMLPLEGDRKPRPFLRTAAGEAFAAFSPDGRWLAYSSDESGGLQVYVQSYLEPGNRWQVSSDGGSQPRWNPNGRELFYRDGRKTMSVPITLSPTFTAGKPRLLYEGPGGVVSPDGQRFLAVEATQSPIGPAEIHLVLNWFEELKARVPAR